MNIISTMFMFYESCQQFSPLILEKLHSIPRLDIEQAFISELPDSISYQLIPMKYFISANTDELQKRYNLFHIAICNKWYLIALQFNIDRSSWLLLVDHSTRYMAQEVDYMSTSSDLSNHTNARYFHHIHSTTLVPQPNLMACCRHCRLHYY